MATAPDAVFSSLIRIIVAKLLVIKLHIGASSDSEEGGSGSDRGVYSNNFVTTNHLEYTLHIFSILVVLFANPHTYKLACHSILAYSLIILAHSPLMRVQLPLHSPYKDLRIGNSKNE